MAEQERRNEIQPYDDDAYCLKASIETAERMLQRAYRTQYCLLASYDATTRDIEKGVLEYPISTAYYCPYQM